MFEDPQSLKAARSTLAGMLEALIVVKTNEAKEIAACISGGLLGSSRFEVSRGRPSTRISELQDEVLGFISAHETYKSLRADNTFMTFAKNMCIIAAHNLNLQAAELKENPQKAETFIEHLVAHYDLVREAGVPTSIIKSHIHSFSVFEVGRVLRDSIEFFGADTDSDALVRTAAVAVFMKRYSSVAEAKQTYDGALADARRVFGADTDTDALVRTAAFQVFTKQYKSVAEAKQTYDGALADARLVFGADTDTDALVRTAAVQVFMKKYSSVAEAKQTYDCALADARRVFGADTDTLVRTAAIQVFTKQYKSVAEAKQTYDGALTDARRVFGADTDTDGLVRTAAVQVFMKKYSSVAEAKQFHTQNGYI
jgi:hypothetical protein